MKIIFDTLSVSRSYFTHIRYYLFHLDSHHEINLLLARNDTMIPSETIATSVAWFIRRP